MARNDQHYRCLQEKESEKKKENIKQEIRQEKQTEIKEAGLDKH